MNSFKNRNSIFIIKIQLDSTCHIKQVCYYALGKRTNDLERPAVGGSGVKDNLYDRKVMQPRIGFSAI